MTEARIQDIYSPLDTLTQKVSSLELLTGTIGTSQVAIAQLLCVQSQHTQILNSHTTDLSQIKSDVAEILRRLRDAYGGKLLNGGSGL